MKAWLWRQGLRGAELLHKVMYSINLRPPVRLVAFVAKRWGDAVDDQQRGRGGERDDHA